MSVLAAHTVLEERPRIVSLRVDELLREVRRGRIRIPRFQRPLKWKAADVALLFDSIYRGYPMGTLLFWERPAGTEVVTFGPVSVTAEGHNQAWFIVDGQQRVAALVGGLLHAPWHPGDPVDDHVLFFDVVQRRFEHPEGRLKAIPPTWLPIQKLADTPSLLAWLDEVLRPTHPGAEDIQRVLEVSAKLQDYQVQVAVVASAEDRPLREIFKRFNTAGRRMEDAEVFDALHGGAGSNGEIRTVAALQRDLDALAFGTFPQDWLLHAAMATHGIDITRDARVGLEDAQVAEDLPRIRDAAAAAVAFLQNHAAIPHILMLPYKLPFIALVKFFFLHPSPMPATVQRLRRWLWRSFTTGALAGDSRPSTRRVLGAVAGDEHDAVAALMAAIPAPKRHPLMRARFGPLPLELVGVSGKEGRRKDWRSSANKLQLAALLHLHPRYWDKQEAIPVALLVGRLEQRDLALLVPPGAPDSASDPNAAKRLPLENTLANQLLWPAPPDLPSWLAGMPRGNADTVLESHALNRAVIIALSQGWYGEALALREKHLRHTFEQFFLNMAEPEHQDRRPLESLVVGEDP